MLSELIHSTLGFLKKYPELVRSMNAKSMTQYTKSTRSEPITMIDHTISNMTEMSDLMGTLTSIYAAMYAQSFSIAINHEIGDIKLLQTLDKINPNRSKMEGVLSLAAGLESNTISLPDYTKHIKTPASVISFEKDNRYEVADANDSWQSAVKDGITKAESGSRKYKIGEKEVHAGGADSQAITKFMSNLTTGIMFEVSVDAGQGRKVDIPITVRLLANKMPANILVSLFTAAVRNQTAKERYREWRAGGLSFWNDVVLCKDILRENRTNMIKDSSGMFSEVLRRKSSNQIAGALSGNPSISQISNIIIVSSETVDLFERETNKKMSQERTRDLIFNNTQTLILAVVNRTRETVTLHYHDIAVPTTVTFRELKKSGGDGGGPDIMEILKAYQMGNGVNL